MNAIKNWVTRGGYASFVILALILLVAFPLLMDIFRLNLVGKYLTYGFVAIGLVMLWAALGLWMGVRLITLVARARTDRWLVLGAAPTPRARPGRRW